MEKTRLTVADLRKALEGVPDHLPVEFNSDTIEDAPVVLEFAKRISYKRNEVDVDYFTIYGNYADEEDEDFDY